MATTASVEDTTEGTGKEKRAYPVYQPYLMVTLTMGITTNIFVIHTPHYC